MKILKHETMPTPFKFGTKCTLLWNCFFISESFVIE